MKNFLITIMVTTFILMLCAWALSMATEYGPGPIVHQPTWPAGLAGVLNSQEREYGYWVGFSADHIYYSGSSAKFDAFIGELSSLQGTPITLVLHDGPGSAARLGDSSKRRFAFDWEVSVERDSKGRASQADITVDLWLGGHVRQDKMCVPSGITVLSAREDRQAAHR
jgi:hypothetical protein